MNTITLRRTIGRLLKNNYYIGTAYHSVIFNLGKIRKKEPLIIYQMGKVGSSTILESLKSSGLFMPIYHVHYLTDEGINNNERINEFPLWAGRYLRKQIDKGFNGKKWKVVTLVREPVARNISAFFQNIYSWVPDFDFELNTRSAEIEKLIEIFLEKYPHTIPLEWFDSEMKPVFGIDVFSSGFPKSAGYKVYRGENADVLLMRLENIEEIPADAFKEFLNIEDFQMIKTNISNEKTYHDVYRKFVNSITLPGSYTGLMYDSKFSKHFYLEEEIKAFKEKWSGRV